MEAMTAERPAAHVLQRGDGAPLLLLHGWGASGELFAPILDALAPGRWLLVPDLPGFGGTDAPPEAWAARDYAAWVIALLDRLGVARADVLGHSHGGRVAITLAAEHPERVRRLVLTSSAGIRRRPSVRQRAGVRTYKTLRKLERWRLAPPPLRAYARSRADRRGSDDYRAASGALRATLVRLVNEDVTPLLARVRAPALLIWGDRDTETPLAAAHVMERLIPDAGLVVFEGAGHFAYLEQPARFCRIVEVFLSGEPA